MTKTEDVLNALNEGKDTKTIIAETGASESLISRCRQRLRRQELENDEPEPTDEEIEAAIKQIKIKPEDKYLNKTPQAEEEDYRCMGCYHEWKATSIPSKCPNCGSEF